MNHASQAQRGNQSWISGTSSTSLSSIGDFCFRSDNPISTAKSVSTSKRLLVIESSTPVSAGWTASAMMRRRMKSKVSNSQGAIRCGVRTLSLLDLFGLVHLRKEQDRV